MLRAVDELFPSISAMTSQIVTGTSASTVPFCVAVPLEPAVSQLLDVSAARPTFTEQMLTGASALSCRPASSTLARLSVSPKAAAAWLKRPIALSCAVTGALASTSPPGWSSPTEVVEQLLPALAATPTDSEHALTGASTFARDDDLSRRVRPGGRVLARQRRAAYFVRPRRDGPLFAPRPDPGNEGGAFDAGLGAVDVDVDVAILSPAPLQPATAFCTACTVVWRPGVDGAAPLAGMTPTTAPAASTSPPVRTPRDVGRFRFMVSFPSVCWGHTPARNRRRPSYPAKRRIAGVHAKVRQEFAKCTPGAHSAID